MRCPDSARRVEGNDCLDAWRDNFRNVPANAQLVQAVQGSARPDPDPSDITNRAAALRRDMATMSGQLDFPPTEAELQNVLSQLPLHRAAGPDGLPYEVFVVDDECLRAAMLTFFQLVRYWAVVPSIWRSARVCPLFFFLPLQVNEGPGPSAHCSLRGKSRFTHGQGGGWAQEPPASERLPGARAELAAGQQQQAPTGGVAQGKWQRVHAAPQRR